MPGRLLLGLDFGHHRRTSSNSIPKTSSAEQSTRSSSSSVASEQELNTMDHLKRASLTGKHPLKKKGSPKSSPVLAPARPAKLDMIIESPPLMFYGPPAVSTGALFSGQLLMQVTDTAVKIERFEMQFLATTTTKKPVADRCPDCSTKTSELHKWVFLKEPIKLIRGEHTFPFSYLIPGHLPATTHGQLGVLDYHLAAKAITSTGDTTTYGREIKIMRSIMPGNDKHSVRIFPPTDLNCRVTLPSVIHPIGEFLVYMRLTGITNKQKDTQTRWRLRKMNWHIEEVEKTISPACPKHAHKVGGEGKGLSHEESRTIGGDEMKQGWKSDFDAGEIEAEFKASINTALKPVCDMVSPAGLTVTHALVIEFVVAEEWAPNKKPNQATPTGAARVLRTQFHLVVTERGGLGISWEEEQPPVYEDVPASPPTYVNIANYEGPPLDEDVDRLHLG
ncbi:hypothetical protein B0A49_01764 [Cryomyces minteri]|uniref:LDB19 N-terminal domain-containing protein n=1 Tax=Cryomyces minteri TaxID=331657 RepID=A0A4U0XTL1_9PEZI|nr:hypothetical protein B0A49_01764 [Cryomyces minteri]